VAAAIQAAEQDRPQSGLRGDLDLLTQMRRRVVDTADPQVQDRPVPQGATQVRQVVQFPARGQPGRADLLGAGQVAGLDQCHRHELAKTPVKTAGELVRNSLRLAHQPERAVPVAGLPVGHGQAGQARRFQARRADLTGPR
jgi:hypothetical protein